MAQICVCLRSESVCGYVCVYVVFSVTCPCPCLICEYGWSLSLCVWVCVKLCVSVGMCLLVSLDRCVLVSVWLRLCLSWCVRLSGCVYGGTRRCSCVSLSLWVYIFPWVYLMVCVCVCFCMCLCEGPPRRICNTVGSNTTWVSSLSLHSSKLIPSCCFDLSSLYTHFF